MPIVQSDALSTYMEAMHSLQLDLMSGVTSDYLWESIRPSDALTATLMLSFLHRLHFRNFGVTVVCHYQRLCSGPVARVTNGKYNKKTLILLLLICSLFC